VDLKAKYAARAARKSVIRQPPKGGYVDFTVVSGYLQCLVVVAALIVLGFIVAVAVSL
jgi:hypothetical protein